MQENLFRRCCAELVGTFCLILFGCGAMSVDSLTGALGHVGVATTWGLVVMIMIYAIGDLSGAHINPAVSVAFAVAGRSRWPDAIAYCFAQCLGALLGAAAIRSVLGVDEVALGATILSHVGPTAGFAIEATLSAVLMFVVMGVSTGAKEKSITAGLAVGATIAMEALVAGPLTKASMNPARSLGPAIVSQASEPISLLWLYILAPLGGAILGAILYRAIRPPEQRAETPT